MVFDALKGQKPTPPKPSSMAQYYSRVWKKRFGLNEEDLDVYWHPKNRRFSSQEERDWILNSFPPQSYPPHLRKRVNR